MLTQPTGSGSLSASSARSASGAMSTPRCARNRAKAVVAKRVCTTERSSAKSRSTMSSHASTIGLPGVPVIATFRAPPRSALAYSFTSVGPGPSQEHDHIVVARHRLGRREGVGLAEASLLARRRPSLGHEQRGAAAHDRDALPGGRQTARFGAGSLRRPSPQCRLARDFLTHVAHTLLLLRR